METLQEWANGLLDKHKDNWDAAAEEGIKIGKKSYKSDPEWVNGFTEELIVRGIYELITKVGNERRSETFKGVNAIGLVATNPKGRSGEEDSKRKPEVQRRVQQRVLMNMWMGESGKHLREATRDDLMQEIKMHTGNAKGNDTKRIFYTKLYEGLPEGKTIKEQYSEAEIKGIRDKARKGANTKWKFKILETTKEAV